MAPVQFRQKFRPRNKKWIVVRNLLRIIFGVKRERFRLAKKENSFLGQIFEQRGERGFILHSAFLILHSLENSQFARRWNCNFRNLLARNLRQRIEVPERFQVVAEKFQPHWPRTCRRKNIQDAAAQSNFAFPGNLRFRFVTLFLQKINQVEWRALVPALQLARAIFQIVRREGFLQKRGDAGDNEF